MTVEPKNSTILLVDDEPEIREIYRELLTYLGYTVIAEQDAPSALDIVRKGYTIDLVITDYRMPGMNGLEFVKVLRTLLPAVPIVMITAFASVENYLQAHNLGVFDYVNKPVRINELEGIVKRALNSSSIREHRAKGPEKYTHR